MRVVLQVVNHASVSVDGVEAGKIGKGFALLIGFTEGDNKEIASKMADKIVKLRLFPDENGKMNLSLAAVNGSILSVSQFTLYGSAKEGNRPSFVNAMKADEARELYSYFYSYLSSIYPFVSGGVFQSYMKVELENDGPTTLILDSKELFK